MNNPHVVYLVQGRYQLKENFDDKTVFVQLLYLFVPLVPRQVALVERHHDVELIIVRKRIHNWHNVGVLNGPLCLHLFLHRRHLLHHNHLHGKDLVVTDPAPLEYHSETALAQHVLHRVTKVKVLKWHLDIKIYNNK